MVSNEGLHCLTPEGIDGKASEQDILIKLNKYGIFIDNQTHKVNVTIWGTGSPLREFMHVDDLAEACYYLMLHYSDIQFVNVGTGQEISIKDVAFLIKDIVGFDGDLIFDTTKPDGTPRKLMDSSLLFNVGYSPKININSGIKKVIFDYKSHQK